MAAHPKKKKGGKKRATLPASRGVVSRKISKVADEHPDWSHKRVVGTALGILRSEKNK